MVLFISLLIWGHVLRVLPRQGRVLSLQFLFKGLLLKTQLRTSYSSLIGSPLPFLTTCRFSSLYTLLRKVIQKRPFLSARCGYVRGSGVEVGRTRDPPSIPDRRHLREWYILLRGGRVEHNSGLFVSPSPRVLLGDCRRIKSSIREYEWITSVFT